MLDWMEPEVVAARAKALSSGRAGGLRCPPIIKKILELDTKGSHWQHHDFVDAGVHSGRQEAVKAMWAATLKEILTELPEKERLQFKLPDSQVLRFLEWLFGELDGTGDSSKARTVRTPEKEPRSGIRAPKPRSGRAIGESDDSDSDEEADPPRIGGGSSPSVMTSKMLMDVNAHPGATNGTQLCYLSACIFLGKHASKVECEGLSYGEHPVSSAVIRKNSKVSALGMQSVTSSFTSARKLCSMAPLTFFFANTRDKMINAPDDHCGFARMGAHRIGTWYDTAMQVATSDSVAIEYFELAVIKGPLNGRGLPEEYDCELMERAKKLAGPAELACMMRPPAAPILTSPANPSSVANERAAMGSQMDEVLKGVESMQKAIETMGKRIDATHNKLETSSQKIESLTSKVKKLENPLTKSEKDETITCNKCGQRGHRAADCPN